MILNQATDRRRNRLIEQLASEGIEKAIITHPLNILYLTGARIKPYERFLALILDVKAKEGTLMLPSLEKSVKTDGNVANVLIEDHEDPVDKLLEVLDAAAIIGIEKQVLSLFFAEGIARRPAIELVDIGSMIMSLRTCKASDEIERIKTAAAHGDGIISDIRDYLTVGVTEKEITFHLMERMSMIPGVLMDEFVIQVLGGINAANPHGMAGERPFEKGDSVTIDFGVHYADYWSDLTRTFFVGDPDPQFKAIYQTVLDAQKSAIDRIRPGGPIWEVDRAARAIIETSGFGSFFIHRTGHGIGLDIHELPSVHEQNTEILKEGMVMTVEPGIYLPGLGGVRIEDDVVVNEDGCTVINTYPKDYEDIVKRGF
jgi:Xaa-Pro dipeptidase